jgi:hypothetical protein
MTLALVVVVIGTIVTAFAVLWPPGPAYPGGLAADDAVGGMSAGGADADAYI